MDDLQYRKRKKTKKKDKYCFKPYYKWMTFNTPAIDGYTKYLLSGF